MDLNEELQTSATIIQQTAGRWTLGAGRTGCIRRFGLEINLLLPPEIEVLPYNRPAVLVTILPRVECPCNISLQARSQDNKVRVLASSYLFVCSSARPHRTTRVPLDRLS